MASADVPQGGDVAIVWCRVLVYDALVAAEELDKDGIYLRVVNNHTIKPMDEAAIVAAARDCGAVVTVEEHQVQAGSARASPRSAASRPARIEFVGVQHRFGQSGSRRNYGRIRHGRRGDRGRSSPRARQKALTDADHLRHLDLQELRRPRDRRHAADPDLAYLIGRAFVQALGRKNICIGIDMQPSGPELLEALTRGAIDGGADVPTSG